ncbi:MAG: hypothetical protein ACSLE9_07795 [Burkholderiaceae bacterium]
MTTETATRTEYPRKSCTRCGGIGRYSYNQLDGERCYGCGGTGRQLASRKVEAIAAEYETWARRQKRPTWADVQVGDRVVADFGSSKVAGVPFVEVTALERHADEVRGWSGVEQTPTAWAITVTLADGSVRKTATHNLIRRYFADPEGRLAAAIAAAWDSLTPRQRKEVING